MNRPALMGILNLTPDSFSGDGINAASAPQAAIQMIEAGADIIDIGAESTRPGATPVEAEEECARLLPFLTQWQQHSAAARTRLSVDTRHAQTAACALEHGATIINDQSGMADDAMARLLAISTCDIIVMHSLTIPANKNRVWEEGVDPITEILHWKETVTARAAAFSIAPERLIFDPGIGFGKRPEQSLALILRAGELVQTGGHWLCGHSRKSYLTLFTDAPANARDPLTLAFSATLAQSGIHYLRIHNVGAHHTLLNHLCMTTQP